MKQVQGAGNSKKTKKDEEENEEGEENTGYRKKDIYGDRIPTKRKKASRFVLYESKPQSRKEISYYMTFLSLLTLHKTLIRSFKNESDKVVNSTKLTIPSHYKGLIYRLIFLKTIYLTRKSHYLKDMSGIVGALKRCALNMFKLCGFRMKYTSSQSTEGQYKGSDWPRVCPNIWNKFGIDPFGTFLEFSRDHRMIEKWKNWQINEFHDRDIFQTSDRLKIVYSMVCEACDIFNLMPGGGLELVIGAKNNEKYFNGKKIYADDDSMIGKKSMNFTPLLVDYMGVHDSFQLLGKRKRDLFNPLAEKYPDLSDTFSPIFPHEKNGGGDENEVHNIH